MRADAGLVAGVAVVEESSARAAELCTQSSPGHRIVSMRDVTRQATAA